ncbi:MAG TPA: FAD-dependent monooxygenase [Capillimicrobium sp.]|nr:FAD-dependent monooxygenase [Capillimicrobium sp.]
MATIDKALIIGGGVSGLAAATALRRRGVDVEVHERYDHLQGRATGFTVWAYAIQHLSDLGVSEDQLAAIGSPLLVTEIRNHRGELLEALPIGDASQAVGHPSYEVDRADLQRVLLDGLGDGVVHMGSEVTAVDAEAGTVTLADGSTREADLILGCDGIHSVARDAVAGHHELTYSGYAAWSAVAEFTSDDLQTGHHIELWGPGHKAGVGDVGGGRARWYITAKADSGEERTPDQLEASVEGWMPIIRDALRATPPETIVRAEGWYLKKLPRWVTGRVALLGDAAHAMTAFGSNGACTAIDDVHDLVRHLDAEATIADALTAYEHDRKSYGEAQVKRANRMGLLAQLHRPLAAARDSFLSHVPAEKVPEIARDMVSGPKVA